MDRQAWLASFSPEAWFAGAAAAIALVALFFTGVAAKAAADQTKIQRQLRIDAAQPYVWADIRPETAQAGLLRLEVGNSGPTVATNIRITTSVPLPASGQRFEERARIVEQRLAGDGIRSLAPGRVLAWTLGVTHQVVAAEGNPPCILTIDADGPFGPLETLSYAVDMDDLRQSDARPVGSLHLVKESIDGLTKQLRVATDRIPSNEPE
ncbi:UNVERIFIED_ORG: hypothetical protein J3D58_000446 [Paenarthrobacter nicotinovorans]